MKHLIKAPIIIIAVVYILLFTDTTAFQMSGVLVGIAFLDRMAAWFDRNVPDSDPRKHF